MKYSFADGKGKVPAHKHKNGGGIVADSVKISTDIYVGKNCRVAGGVFLDGAFRGGVFHGGTFYGGVFYGGTFYDGTFHGGVFHGGEFTGGNWNRTPLQYQGSLYFINPSSAVKIAIGCEVHTPKEWLGKTGRNLVKVHNLTKDEISEYRQYIKLIAKHYKMKIK